MRYRNDQTKDSTTVSVRIKKETSINTFKGYRILSSLVCLTLMLARKMLDLAGSEEIQSAHLAEALQYRPKIMYSTM
jgi:predicted ATPase with chaperone activity